MVGRMEDRQEERCQRREEELVERLGTIRVNGRYATEVVKRLNSVPRSLNRDSRTLQVLFNGLAAQEVLLVDENPQLIRSQIQRDLKRRKSVIFRGQGPAIPVRVESNVFRDRVLPLLYLRSQVSTIVGRNCLR